MKPGEMVDRVVDPNKLAGWMPPKIDMKGKPLTEEDMEEAIRLAAGQEPYSDPRYSSYIPAKSTHHCDGTNVKAKPKKKPPKRTDTYWNIRGKPKTTKPAK